MRHKAPKIYFMFILSMITMIVALAGVLTHAYFTTIPVVYTNEGNKEIAKIGMELSLLFDRLDSNLNPVTTTTNEDGTTSDKAKPILVEDGRDVFFNKDAAWGSKNNPYIISNIRHLQNLSALQRIGYFDKLYLNKNVDDSGNLKDEIDVSNFTIPYFLICTPEGTPVTIDGTNYNIETIGTDEYPFIGYVGGAFEDGITTIGGSTSDVSTVYGLTIKSNNDRSDVGLFGTVGFIGDDTQLIEPGPDEKNPDKHAGSFEGIHTTIRNMLLYDIKIVVSEPAWADSFSDFINKHMRFSFEKDKEDNTVPHENHHIGILAGHVEYATIEFISVYYSDPSISAMDVTHKKNTIGDKEAGGQAANYYSQTGIIGFLYGLNPNVEDLYIAEGTDNNTIQGPDINGGAGTGGGLLSGEGRGYLSASKVYSLYQDNGNIVSFDLQKGDEYVGYYGLLVIKNGANYYLEDLKTEVELENDTEGIPRAKFTDNYKNFFGQNRTDTYYWDDFVVKDGSNYYYRNLTGTPATNVQGQGLMLRYAYNDENDVPLCNQWVRDRILFGTQATNMYYFSDGVFTFALSSKNDTIEPTWMKETDTFYVGENNASSWRQNISKGNRAAVAYIRQIYDNTDLAQMAAKNVPLFVMAKPSSTSGYLMTLNKPSGSDYTTSGRLLNFYDQENIDSLIAGYNNGSNVLKSYQSLEKETIDEEMVARYLYNGLNNTGNKKEQWYAINVGSESQDITNAESLEDIKENFQIIANNKKASGSDTTSYYSFVDNNTSEGDYTGITISNSDLTNNQYKTYKQGDETTQTTGFFYIRTNTRNASLIHSSGGPIGNSSSSLDTLKSNLIVVGESMGQPLYKNKNGDEKGILLSLDNNNYYLEDGTPVDVQGEVVKPKKPSEFLYHDKTYNYDNYFYRVSTSNGYEYYDSNNTKLNVIGDPVKGTEYRDGNTYYLRYTLTYKDARGTTKTITGAYLEKFTYFSFSNSTKENRLYLIYKRTDNKVAGITCYSTFSYNLYCNTYAKATSNGVDSNKKPSDECAVTFSADGSCTLLYYNQMNRYVNYNDEKFAAGVTKSDMYIYALEVIQEVSYGRISFDPIESSTNSGELPADEYVLWPDYSASDYTATTNASTVADPTYFVVNLANLKNLEHQYYGKEGPVENGWKNDQGDSQLQPHDLSKYFRFEKGLTFGVTVNLFNGQLSSDGFLTAPVGSLGVEANIPAGGVAFRINKSNSKGYYIRTIVSVPVCKYYRNEKDAPEQLEYNSDYFLGVWKVEAGGDSLLQTFQARNAYQKVELPRSNPYEPGTTPGDQNSIYIKTYYNMSAGGTVPNKDTTYRTYLNGRRILVAYAFKVYDEGVYVIGASNEDRNNQSFPMEIVFFSADATASAGRDGSQGSVIGSIDFVYSNSENKILTVKSHSYDNGEVNYSQYYYASLTSLYIENTLKEDVNDFKVYVRRKLETDGLVPVLYLETEKQNEERLLFNRYLDDADYTATKRSNQNEYTWKPLNPGV